HIDLAHCLERDVDHPDVHPMRRLVDAWRVNEDDLPCGAGLVRPAIILHADDARPRRLRLVRDDGELVTDDAVEECGLAGVGAAEKGDETGFHRSSAAS